MKNLRCIDRDNIFIKLTNANSEKITAEIIDNKTSIDS